VAQNNIIYTEDQVTARINEMAAWLVDRYKLADSVLFVSLLNGAVPFTAQLMSAIYRYDPDFNANVQFMKVSRYGDSRQPGELKIMADLSAQYRDLKGRKVVLLDELLDGGGTLHFAKNHLLGYGADSVDCVVLVKKLKQLTADVEISLCGFEAPDAWLTGMGMDDSSSAPEANRWAPWIAIAE
jgi:hypoxanthine phosphoribosyltransferase